MSDVSVVEADVMDFLRREVFAPEVALDAETNLVAAGFDSMSLVRLLLFVEKKYSLWIPEGEITAEALANARALAHTILRVRHGR